MNVPNAIIGLDIFDSCKNYTTNTRKTEKNTNKHSKRLEFLDEDNSNLT